MRVGVERRARASDGVYRAAVLSMVVGVFTLTFATDVRAQASPSSITSYEAQFFAPFSVDNAFDMIARLPGFQFEAGADVRGLAGAGGNVLIDGQRPTSKNEKLEDILKRIPARDVLLIDVVHGGAPGVDMQGKSVVANIKRRAQGGASGLIELGANAETNGRVDRHLRLEARKRSGARAMEIALTLSDFRGDGEGEGPRVRVNAAGATIVESYNTGYFKSRSPAAHLSGVYETPFLGGDLHLNFAGTERRAKQGYRDVLTVPGSIETLRDESDQYEGELGAHYGRRLGPRTGWELLGLAQAGNENTRSAFAALTPAHSTRFQVDKRTSEFVGRTVLKHEALPNLSLEAGGELAYNALHSATDLDIDGAPAVLAAANVTVKEKRGELFAAATWRPAHALTLESGVRIEGSAISSAGDVTLSKQLAYVKPRLAATLDLPGRTQVRLRAEYEVDQLKFEDFAASSSLGGSGVTAGNPDLNPERAVVLEGVVEKRFGRDGALVARYTRSDLSDITDYAPIFSGAGVASAKANIGEGEAEEAALALTLPLQALGVPGGLLKPSVTWRASSVLDPSTGVSRRLSDEIPLSWSVAFTQDSPIWPLVWGVSVTGDEQSQLFRVTEVTTSKKQVMVEAFADLKLPHAWAVRVDLKNLAQRDVNRWREVFIGSRGDDVLNYVDVRRLRESPELYLRLRRRF